MLVFMFVDVVLAILAAGFVMLPSGCCDIGGGSIVTVTGTSTSTSTITTTTSIPCKRPYSAVHWVVLAYAIIKAVTTVVLCKLIFRPQQVKRPKNKSAHIKNEWVYFWRLAPKAILLPPVGLVLVHYVTREFPEEAKKRNYNQYCVHSQLVPWWVANVSVGIMCLLLAVETIMFTCCNERYLNRSPGSAATATTVTKSAPPTLPSSVHIDMRPKKAD